VRAACALPVNATAAFATVAPVLSVTVPRMLPLVSARDPVVEPVHAQMNKATSAIAGFISTLQGKIIDSIASHCHSAALTERRQARVDSDGPPAPTPPAAWQTFILVEQAVIVARPGRNLHPGHVTVHGRRYCRASRPIFS
jgi:hypothetical protein